MKKTFLDRYSLNFMADNRIILCICITIDTFLIFGFSLITNIFSLIKYGFKLRYILPIFDSVWIYLLLFLLLIIIDIILLYRIKINFENLNIHHKGDSSFTSEKDLVSQYKAVGEKGEIQGGGGVVISHIGENFLVDDSPVNNLIIGITRSGKFEVFVAPVIDIYSRSDEKPSLVINDPKGEILSSSYDTLINRGYDIKIINTSNPNFSSSYNPLSVIVDCYKLGDIDMAQTLTISLSNIIFSDKSTLSKDSFWEKTSSTLTSAIILAHVIDCVKLGCEEKINLYSVANFLSSLGSKTTTNPFTKERENALDKFFEIRKQTDIAKRLYGTVMLSTGQTRTSIFTNTMNKLNLFSISLVAKMTGENEIDFKAVGFGKKPTAIFLLTPDYDSSLHFLSGLFIKQLYTILARQCDLSPSRRCSRQVVFLLDEFGNMPTIPDMESIITVCLGRNIRFNLIVQDYEQIKSNYPNSYKTIISNCGNQIYLLTGSIETAKTFSSLMGSSTEKTFSRNSQNLLLNSSLGEHYEEKPLLNPTQLMELKQGESVVVRVMKRTDLLGNDIVSNPIFNKEKTRLKPRLSYLDQEFDTGKSIFDIPLKPKHIGINLEDIIYLPEVETPPTNLIETIPLEGKQEETSEENTQKNTSILSDLISSQQLKILEKKLGIILNPDETLKEFTANLQQMISAGEILPEEKDQILELLKPKEKSKEGDQD